MTQKQGDVFIISSDRFSADLPTKTAPKAWSDSCEVWTGEAWTNIVADAKAFATLEDADNYVRENFARVTGMVAPPEKHFRWRPKQP